MKFYGVTGEGKIPSTVTGVGMRPWKSFQRRDVGAEPTGKHRSPLGKVEEASFEQEGRWTYEKSQPVIEWGWSSGCREVYKVCRECGWKCDLEALVSWGREFSLDPN